MHANINSHILFKPFVVPRMSRRDGIQPGRPLIAYHGPITIHITLVAQPQYDATHL